MAGLGILVIVLDLFVSRKGLLVGFAFLGLLAPLAFSLAQIFDISGSGLTSLVPDDRIMPKADGAGGLGHNSGGGLYSVDAPANPVRAALGAF